MIFTRVNFFNRGTVEGAPAIVGRYAPRRAPVFETQNKAEKMLVLSRKQNDRVLLRVGDVEISITIVDIRQTIARIGVEAPDSVAIIRGELLPGTAPPPKHPTTAAPPVGPARPVRVWE